MIQIRPIRPSDNAMLAKIIRNTLVEFGANHPGTVYFDKSTDDLFNLFQQDDSEYFVVELENGQIAGGGGIFATAGLPAGTCELVKMYLVPEVRGKGIGGMVLEKCFRKALELGYHQIYLETMPELKLALKVYERYGFNYICAPMGNSGHFGCDLFMRKNLSVE